MKKLIPTVTLIIALFALSLGAKAQAVVANLKQADREYNLYNYSKAVDLYLKEYKKNANYYLAEHIANCYRLLRDYENQEKWYAIAITLDGTKPDNILKYGNALKNNQKYLEAKAQFTRYVIWLM